MVPRIGYFTANPKIRPIPSPNSIYVHHAAAVLRGTFRSYSSGSSNLAVCLPSRNRPTVYIYRVTNVSTDAKF